jgi:uncharacterized protein with FMN-binding domain
MKPSFGRALSGFLFANQVPVGGCAALALFAVLVLAPAASVPGAAPAPAGPPRAAPVPYAPAAASGVTRTQAEVEALIQQAANTPPDWWDSVQLNYPATLNLMWVEEKGPWNEQKNLSQYIWSVIDENPGKWREGAKLLHHVLIVNKGDQVRLAKTMDALGRLYHDCLQDYARAAFWWRKAQAFDPQYATSNGAELAHCYWKLGCKPMAVAGVGRFTEDGTRHGAIIKLWAEMGDLDRALAMAERTARVGCPDIGYLAAGDACRLTGRYKQALDYYQKVLAATQGFDDIKQNKARAQASMEAIRAAEGTDLARIRDGIYTATSIAYAGPLEVEVVVQARRIVSVKVTKHQEKQYYSAFTDTPARIVEMQGIRGVDAVTSATITSEAVLNAAAKALAQGMK